MLNREGGSMLHEMRTYTIRIEPGGVRELERRFGNAIDIRLKYSRLGGFFHTLSGEMSQVVHIWPYENLKDRAESRAAANRDDSNRWPPGIGELFEKQEVEILTPAPFMRPLEPQKIGRLWELSWVEYPPNSVDQALSAYEKAMPDRDKQYPVIGCWTVDIGADLGRIYTLMPYRDWEHRNEVREAQSWPPQSDVPALATGSKLLEPSWFSTLQ
ncbi:MAG: hypothetical protein GEU75_16440 [Dehalococcoidia bacterium]|nr:hypothetical protein [Dehalococcoidia bacterium]